MTSVAVIAPNSAPLPSKSAPKQVKTLTVTGKNRVAIEAMVWEGLKRPDAAAKAGLTDHSLYVAMTKPHVKAFYLAQCEMLRLSGKARRIHRLNEMVEQDDNKAAVVNAVALLERLGDDNPSSSLGNSRSPGVVVIIQQQSALMGHERGLEPKPLITLEGVHHVD